MKFNILVPCFLLILSLFLISFSYFFESTPSPSPSLQDGDLIFHTSKTTQSIPIQIATQSPYSHVGIIFFRQGKPYVLEAAGKVRYTPLQKWINRGKNKRYIVKRLKKPLLLPDLKDLKTAAKRFHGLPYDYQFQWGPQKLYCSELAYLVYQEALQLKIGKRKPLKEYNVSAPLVQALLKQRFKSKTIPYEHPMIAPSDIFESNLLIQIYPQV